MASAQPAARENAIAVSFLPESETVAPGQRIDLAIVMRPKPGWHGYWQNPGDAGMPARIDWRLPSGVEAGGLRYPVPTRLVIAGIMNYVFERDHALLAELRVPKGIAPGTMLPISAKLDYLACTDRICVPESATVSTRIRIVEEPPAEAENRALIDRYRQALPRPIDGEARYGVDNGRLRIAVPLPRAVKLREPYFFPLTDRAMDYSASQILSRNGDWLIVETAAAEPAGLLQGVLRIGEGQGLEIVARPGQVPAGGAPVAATTGDEQGSATAILLALGGAILGGLLLNLMPCVFPILSLKALSLARAGGDGESARRDAMAYTAGLVLVCLALGGALLALRASGSTVGWAFQLQDPRVILFLLLLVTGIALNLAGLFELPSIGAGGRLARAPGAAGAFWTGALAAFVATPCTGPFMGAALGAALILPGPAALAVFAGLGLGLALPFLLLGFVPMLRRLLPKPGPWMIRLRRILSVPMALTALGLAWILWRQSGAGGLAIGAAAALAVAACLWWAGRRSSWLATGPAFAAVVAAIFLVPSAASPAMAPSQAIAGAEPFSEQKLEALRKAGRPVFVYFTADWCLTCKVNEKAVLERKEVPDAFARNKVAVLVGDWTTGDPAIGRFIESHGRSGVPLYLFYAPGREAEILPQILSVARLTALGEGAATELTNPAH